MKQSEVIQGVLKDFEYQKGLEVFKAIVPNQKVAIQRLEAYQNESRLKSLLKGLLSDLSVYQTTYQGQFEKKKEIKVSKNIKSIAVASIELPQMQEELEEENYPEHYPPILQQLLIDAAKKIRQKRKLSSQLHENKPKNQSQRVSQILKFSEEITEIYQAKKCFDEQGYLPEKLTGNLKDYSNEIKELQHQMKLAKSRISKNKAKLKNPKEFSRGNPQLWREKIEQDEKLKAELIQKIQTLKNGTY